MAENENLGTPHVSRGCPSAPQPAREYPGFLTAAERKAAEQEVAALASVTPWHATYSLRETLGWAKKHPDALNPEVDDGQSGIEGLVSGSGFARSARRVRDGNGRSSDSEAGSGTCLPAGSSPA